MVIRNDFMLLKASFKSVEIKDKMKRNHSEKTE